MQSSSRGHSLWSLLLFTCLCAPLGATSSADDGRNFAGVYDVQDLVENGDRCTFTFVLLLQNVSGQDQSGVQLRLGDRLDLAATYAKFDPVDLADRAQVRLSKTTESPCMELQRWNSGWGPFLIVEGPTLQSVELMRGPVPEQRP